MDLRRQYQTQQKAKSAILTAQSQNELNDLGTIADSYYNQLHTGWLYCSQRSPKTILN
jgi:hypothetical protein